MNRHGGSAIITSTSEGTEVRLGFPAAQADKQLQNTEGKP
jgi:hypothetical protein